MNVSDSDTILNIARNVIRTEAKGLEALEDSLDHNFFQATTQILTTKNRLIISGMGKSGHIARKIAATLASVGTPAFFLHPGEASHGDLGMICQGDTMLTLSNSGETTELENLLEFCKRNQIPLISITARRNSTLAKMSDIPLIVPEAPEACPLNLAPTTSTTMMLALGDALAVTLLEMRKFTPEDFAMFHPGGKLGQRLLKVEDLMHQAEKMPLTNHNCPMAEVLIEISAKSFGCSGIIADNGELIGIITDGDLRRWLTNNRSLETIASQVMSQNVRTIAPTLLAAEAVSLMNHRKITSLFVVIDKSPLGIVHIHDCLRIGLG